MAPIASPRIARGRRISRTIVGCTSLPPPNRASITVSGVILHRADAERRERQQHYQYGKAARSRPDASRTPAVTMWR